jgi:hypothetical protein
MIIVNGLPMNKPLVDENGELAKVWLQALGDIGDSLQGRWGNVVEGDLVESGVTYASKSMGMQLLGNVLVVSLKYEGLTSTSGTLDFSAIKFNPMPGVLNYFTENIGNNWDISSGIYIDSSVISLPDVVSTDVLITGTLIRN